MCVQKNLDCYVQLEINLLHACKSNLRGSDSCLETVEYTVGHDHKILHGGKQQ